MDQQPQRSVAYLAWVVGVLALSQTSSFADRTVIVVLQPMIKDEFRLSDFQVGLLGGLAFAAVYAVLGLPLARLAERRSRRLIIVASLVVWSVMTTFCGFASSYAMLFLLRCGVGIGEAGATPSSHSMIADYISPSHRGRATSVLTIGTPLGAMLGSVIGGLVAQHHGWRSAFLVVGLPGLLLALVIFATVQEPPRQAAGAAATQVRTWAACLRDLVRRDFFRHLALAQVLAAIPGYGISAFAAIYLVRAFGFSTAHAGIVLGLGFGVAYAGGLIAGGLSHDRRGFGWLPALATFAAAPVLIASYLTPVATTAVVMIVASCFLQAFALAPTYAAIHNRIPSNMRATAIAVLLLMTNLLGAGLGPALVGFASDRFAGLSFAGDPGYALACPGGNPAAGAAPALAAACKSASTVGLRWAIVLVALSFVWSAAHYALASRRMRDDRAARPDAAAAHEAAGA